MRRWQPLVTQDVHRDTCASPLRIKKGSQFTSATCFWSFMDQAKRKEEPMLVWKKDYGMTFHLKCPAFQRRRSLEEGIKKPSLEQREPESATPSLPAVGLQRRPHVFLNERTRVVSPQSLSKFWKAFPQLTERLMSRSFKGSESCLKFLLFPHLTLSFSVIISSVSETSCPRLETGLHSVPFLQGGMRNYSSLMSPLFLQFRSIFNLTIALLLDARFLCIFQRQAFKNHAV